MVLRLSGMFIIFKQPPMVYTTYKNGTCYSEPRRERISTGCETGKGHPMINNSTSISSLLCNFSYIIAEINNRMFAYYKGMPQNTFSAFSQTDMSDVDYARSYIWDTDCILLHSTISYQGCTFFITCSVKLVLQLTILLNIM